MKKAIVFIEPSQIEIFFCEVFFQKIKISQILTLSTTNQQQLDWLSQWSEIVKKYQKTIFYFVLSSSFVDTKVEYLPKIGFFDQKRLLNRLERSKLKGNAIYQLKGRCLFCYSLKTEAVMDKIFTIAEEQEIQVAKIVNFFDLLSHKFLKNLPNKDIYYQTDSLLHFYTYQDGYLKAKRDLYLQPEESWLAREVDNWQRSTGKQLINITSEIDKSALISDIIKKSISYSLPHLRKSFFKQYLTKITQAIIFLTSSMIVISFVAFIFFFQEGQQLTEILSLKKREFITVENQQQRQQQQDQILSQLQQYDLIRPPEKCLGNIKEIIKKAWPLEISHYTWQYEFTKKEPKIKFSINLQHRTEVNAHQAMLWIHAVANALQKQQLTTSIEQSPLPLRPDQNWTNRQQDNNPVFQLTIETDRLARCI